MTGSIASVMTPTTGSAAGLRVTVGPPALDPVLAQYLKGRWRACWSELREIASIMGWESRLPKKEN